MTPAPRQHPKTVRRFILTRLYDHFLEDPNDIVPPEEFLEEGGLNRRDLMSNAFYLNDRGLIELMLGFNPQLFDGARITADGVDVVENRLELDRRFPVHPDGAEAATADVFRLADRVVEEVDFAPLDGDERAAALRDVQFLREEVQRPVHRWRMEVIRTVLGWLEAPFREAEAEAPTLETLRHALERAHERALRD